MNKYALKKFATEARRELLDRVKLQAARIGINAESIEKANVESSDAVYIGERRLTDIERRQRNKLIARIEEVGYNRVMDEVAYTWFNRFIALRYMEVNDYLPTKVRVLSSSNPSSTEPEMIKEALSIDLDLDKDHVYQLKMDNNTEELFKYLIKMHCNDLNRYMPFMFETIEDYTEILFPEGLLGTDSFVRRMTDTEFIPEDNWRQIEVIGWLYQYYIAEEKERVFKAKTKYKAEEIPYATQLFTPNWIVKYMVQNSLGRYWTEAHPEHEDLKANWEFFLEHQEEDFYEKIAPYVNKALNVEDIKCFDPAMGSGHILIYMFDLLYEIYSKCGYIEREIPRLIIEKNLYGLDIDERAYQLASFSIVMKALQYNRRFLRNIEREGLLLNLSSINETNGCTDELIAYIAKDNKGNDFEIVKSFLKQYKDAKTFGSLMKLCETETNFLENRLSELKENPVTDLFEEEKRKQTLELLPLLIKQTKIMRQKYEIVVLNPPYMGFRYINKELSEFLRKNYPDSKADLFAAFMEIDHYLDDDGFYAAVNQHSWMFLSSFEMLRLKLIKTKFIDSMLHLGSKAFEDIGGEVVQSTSFVLRNRSLTDSKGIYVRLLNEKDSLKKKNKAVEANLNPNIPQIYYYNQEDFLVIPGNPIAYWVSKNFRENYINNMTLNDVMDIKQGLATGDNSKYLRLWYEVAFNDIGLDYKSTESFHLSKKKYAPYNKGGGFKKWYGNCEYVIKFNKKNFEELSKVGNHLPSRNYYFRDGITWTLVSTRSSFGARISNQGFVFDVGGSSGFAKDNLYNFLGFLCSKVAYSYLEILNPTINVQVGDLKNLPYNCELNNNKAIEQLVSNAIEIAKNDWDSFETSWHFKKHPIIQYKFDKKKIEDAFTNWNLESVNRIQTMLRIENELNKIFVEIYRLKNELSSEINKEDITVNKANLVEDIKSFISYGIGCSFGRFSLDEEGLIHSGGDFDASLYNTFPVDKDNILPILPGVYFENDIVTRFVDFVRVTFGDETLEENLIFIADAISRKGNETTRETLRRYFLNDFYKDHLQIYKKRPIYWLFTSGKEKAFNCLIYMHRYDKTMLSRIRTDYLHPVQIRMDAEREELLAIIEGDSTSKEINQAKRELRSLEKKIDELKAYDEKLHHMADMQIEINLDDGVKVNYEKFKGLVAKI